MRRGPILILAALLVGPGCGELRSPMCDHKIEGLCVSFRSERPWVNRADLLNRVHHLVEESLHYWGADWSAVSGWSILVQDQMIDGYAMGRSYMNSREIVVSTEWAKDCVEQSPIPHELGHAIIYDPGHVDARWRGFDPLASAMTEYTRDLGDLCYVYPLMW